MIGIFLQNPVFEQDLRELLMAFYPGQTFAYERQDGLDFYIESYMNEDKTKYYLMVEGVTETDLKIEGIPAVLKEELSQEPLTIHFEDHFDTKNKIKRRLYGLLYARSGRLLPWGTLTGIRPVKIISELLNQGKSIAAVSVYMKNTYLISDEKLNLMLQTATTESLLLTDFPYQEGYSLYIGIPFCPTTCLYCSFTSYPIAAWQSRTREYLDTLSLELDYVSKRMNQRPPDTIYIGGGTPTALSAEDLEYLMNKVASTFDLSKVREFTVESGRPDSITEEKLLVLQRYGITRISINPQTMKQATLDLIGRRHTVSMIKECFSMARKMGFDNINMDLIIGLPNETIADVENTMAQIKELGPDSITVHSLAIKRAARLNMFKEQYADVQIASTQEIIDLTARYAQEMEMQPYYLYRQKNMAGNFENVGYAKAGKACIYNILMMEEKQTILACGAGTSTKVVYRAENRLERAENVKDIGIYISRIEEMIQRKEKLLAKIEN